MEIFSNRKKFVRMNWVMKCIAYKMLSLRQFKTGIRSCIISPSSIHPRSKITTMHSRHHLSVVRRNRLPIVHYICWCWNVEFPRRWKRARINKAMVKKSAHFRIGLRSSVFTKKGHLRRQLRRRSCYPYTHAQIHSRSAYYPHVAVSHWLSLSCSSLSLHPFFTNHKAIVHFYDVLWRLFVCRNMPPLVLVIFGSFWPSTIFVTSPSNLVFVSMRSVYLPLLGTSARHWWMNDARWRVEFAFGLRSFCVSRHMCFIRFWNELKHVVSRSHSMQFESSGCQKKEKNHSWTHGHSTTCIAVLSGIFSLVSIIPYDAWMKPKDTHTFRYE